MITFIMKENQKPSEETLKRLSELKDEDIVFDDDCPEMTHKMEKALECAAAQRNRLLKTISMNNMKSEVTAYGKKIDEI